MRINKFLIIFFLLLPIRALYSQSTLVLTDASMEYIIPNHKIEIYKDQGLNLDIATVLSDSTLFFSKASNEDFKSIDIEADYWIRFSVYNNTSKDFRWFIEEYNFNAEHLVVYYQNSTGKYDSLALTGSNDFTQRFINHKNLVFPIPASPGESNIYYLKYKSNTATPPQFIVREANYFISYAINEYFLIGIFYGILGLITLNSIISFFKYRNSNIGYFSVFICSVVLFFLSIDGIGFQYLWSSMPVLNKIGKPVFHFCSIIGFVLFSAEVLKVRYIYPAFDKYILVFIGLRMIYLILQIIWPQIITIPYIDILLIFLILIVAVQSKMANSVIPMFFIAGIGFMLAALIVYSLSFLDNLQVNNFAFYSFYMVPLLSILCFYQSAEEAFKIQQSKQNDHDLINSELENKVNEKTQELLLNSKLVEDRIKAQDTFIFKVTHDLKGPLRSIVGLVKSARIDKKTAPEIYLDYILKSCERLETVISDLLTISRTTSKDLQFSKVDFKVMISDVVESFKGNSEDNFEVITDFEQSVDFYTENTLLYSVFQNLIENAMNYRNPDALPNSYLHISIKESSDQTVVYFKDNGIGIPEEFIAKVFDMFYRVEERHNNKSTGLGLYLVKIGLNRLQSTVEVQSKIGEGTTFILKLKNFYADIDHKESRKLELV